MVKVWDYQRASATHAVGGKTLRGLGIVIAAGLLALSVAAGPASAASVPAHKTTFSCYYASGQRVIRANVPTASSFLSGGEQVYWFAEVYKQTSAGLTYVGITRSRLATAWAMPYGIAPGALVPGGSWVEMGTNNILIHGGALTLPSAGTYKVVGRFEWASFSTDWTSDWAMNADYPAYNTCNFAT